MAATVGVRTLFIGGIPAGGVLASDVVDVYDDATGTWSTARLSLPRSSLAVAALADRLLIPGGAFGGQVTVPSNRVDIYQVP